MNNRSARARILGFLGASAALALGAGCGPKAADINHVQPGYVKKSIFQTSDEWYYRRTVAKSETLNAYAIEGSGDIFLDRVRFRITEDQVVAYKPYEAIEGAQDGQYVAALSAVVTAFDFGAVARWATAWARMIRASGMPISATACAAATAVCRAVGSAIPMSSLAEIINRRATNRGSSPASSIRAR